MNANSKQQNPPAFAAPEVVAPDGTTQQPAQEGATLLDYFAAQALAGIAFFENRNGYPEPGAIELKYAAEAAYAYAAEMLEARKKYFH